MLSSLKIYSDSIHEVLRVDRYAVWKESRTNIKRLVFLSAIASESQVSAVRAVFQLKKRLSLILDNESLQYIDPNPYRVAFHKLPKYRSCHMVVVAEMEGLLLGPIERAVGDYLMSNAIDSPMKPEWIPYITDRLGKAGGIKRIDSLGVDASIALFGSEDVDEIISQGIRQGDISIVAPELARKCAS